VNRAQRWREVIQVCNRLEVARGWTPPDWQEWAYCTGCQADQGHPCYDVIGSTKAFRVTYRLSPHPERPPAAALEEDD
jgi:hypothetical protein